MPAKLKNKSNSGFKKSGRFLLHSEIYLLILQPDQFND